MFPLDSLWVLGLPFCNASSFSYTIKRAFVIGVVTFVGIYYLKWYLKRYVLGDYFFFFVLYAGMILIDII